MGEGEWSMMSFGKLQTNKSMRNLPRGQTGNCLRRSPPVGDLGPTGSTRPGGRAVSSPRAQLGQEPRAGTSAASAPSSLSLPPHPRPQNDRRSKCCVQKGFTGAHYCEPLEPAFQTVTSEFSLRGFFHHRDQHHKSPSMILPDFPVSR